MTCEIGGLCSWVALLGGALIGAIAAIGALCLALLKAHDKLQAKERKLDAKTAEAKLTEQEAQRILNEALPSALLEKDTQQGKNGDSGDGGSSAMPVPTVTRQRTSDSLPETLESAIQALAEVDVEIVEDNWQTLMRVSKDRQRDIRSLAMFLQEFVQLQQNLAKSCHKLSKHADSMFQGSEDAIIVRWSRALSAAVAQLGAHTESLGTSLAAEIEQRLVKLADEHAVLEKTLAQEATRLMKELKDAVNEHQQAEATRDRMAVRLEQAAEKSQKQPVKEAVQSKHIRRLQVAEADAKETSKTLNQIRHIFQSKMPRVQKDFKLLMHNEQSTLQDVLMRFSQMLLASEERRTGVYTRLQVDLSSTELSTGSAYDAMMGNALSQATQGSGLSNEIPKLDMASEAAAALASSLPSSLPPFPETLKDSVQPETAVWFNAFLGRLYRDIARSPVFHEWLLTKLHFQLNKGKLPEFIDELHVSDLKFGATPPLLRNVRWVPVRMAEGHDLEYDVVFLADILFRGGLGFSVTTKLWVNWPRDRYAFLPVRIDLELSELLGTIRFGVTKHNTFVGFTEEPFTKFTVQSAVGNNLKIENLPKISNVIVNRIKRSIRNRLVYPKAHRFRLIWPYKWWPDITPDMLATTMKQATAGTGVAESVSPPPPPPELVDPAKLAEANGPQVDKDSPSSAAASSTSSNRRRGSGDLSDRASGRQFFDRMLRKKHGSGSGSGSSSRPVSMSDVSDTSMATESTAATDGDRSSRRKASHMAASLGSKLKQAMAHRPPVHMGTHWLRPRRSSDVSHVDAKEPLTDEIGSIDMEYDEDEDMMLHPAEAERGDEHGDDSETDDEEETEEMKARWAQLLEAAHRHVENNQEGVEIADVPRAPVRQSSMHLGSRPRVVSTDFRPQQRSDSVDKETLTMRRRERSRSLSDFRTTALLAATDDTKDDQSHPSESVGLGARSPRSPTAGADDFEVGLRSSHNNSRINHARSASDGAAAGEELLIPSYHSISASRKGSRQVPLPFDPTASGASVMKGSLKVVKPGLTTSLALARRRWVEIQAGVLKIFENEGDIIPKATYALRGSTCRPMSSTAAFEIVLPGATDHSHHITTLEEHFLSDTSPRASSTEHNLTKAVRLICQAESEALSRAWIVAIQSSARL